MFRSIFLSVVALILASYGASTFLAGQIARPQRPALDAKMDAPATIPEPNLAPGRSGFGELQIAQDSSGNYLTEAEIDGHPTRMIVDTGATYVSLTSADADAAGFRPAPQDFRYRTVTANGTGVAAKIRIARLRIANMEVDDVEAFVTQPGTLEISLLGMNALNRLGKVEISDGRLVLRQ